MKNHAENFPRCSLSHSLSCNYNHKFANVILVFPKLHDRVTQYFKKIPLDNYAKFELSPVLLKLSDAHFIKLAHKYICTHIFVDLGTAKSLWRHNEPLTRYATLRVVYAPGIPGTLSPPPTSKETAICRSRHASRHVWRPWRRCAREPAYHASIFYKARFTTVLIGLLLANFSIGFKLN